MTNPPVIVPDTDPYDSVEATFAHNLIAHVAGKVAQHLIDGPWACGDHVFASDGIIILWAPRKLLPAHPERKCPGKASTWPAARNRFARKGYKMPSATPPRAWMEPEPCVCVDLVFGPKPSCQWCCGNGETRDTLPWYVRVPVPGASEARYIAGCYAELLGSANATVYPALPGPDPTDKTLADFGGVWIEVGEVSGIVAACDPRGLPGLRIVDAVPVSPESAASPTASSSAAPPHQVNDTPDRERDEHDRDLEHRRDAHGQPHVVGAPESGEPPVGSPMNSRP